VVEKVDERALLGRLPNLPLPDDSSTSEEWEAWMVYDALVAALTGLASRKVRLGEDYARGWRDLPHGYVNSDGLARLIGPRRTHFVRMLVESLRPPT